MSKLTFMGDDEEQQRQEQQPPVAPAAPTGPVKLKFMEESAIDPKALKKEDTKEELAKKATMNPWEAALWRGATFGLSDRLFSGVDALSGRKSYDDALKERFAQRDQFNDENPIASIATEIGGGVLTGGPIVSGVKAGVKAAAPRVAEFLGGRGAAPALGRVGGVLAGGAATGAVSGAGQAELGKTGEGATRGALTGMAAAGALQGVGKGAKFVFDKGIRTPTQHIGNVLGITKPEKWAQEEWLKSVGLDGDDLGGLAKKIREMDPNNERGMMAMDVAGINAKSKLKAAATQETQARGVLDQKMSERGLERQHRLEELLRDNVSKRFDASQTADDIYNSGRQRADPLYKQLSERGEIDDDRIIGWFNQTPDRRAFLQEYAAGLSGKGKPMNFKWAMDDQGFLTKERAPTWDDVHSLYKKIGEMRNEAFDNNTGRKINGHEYSGKELQDEYNSLRDLLNDVTKGEDGKSVFAEAQKISGDAFEVKKALKAGQDITKLGFEDFKKMYGGFGSLPEQEAFRIGAASQIKKMLEKSDGVQAVNKMYGKGMKEKLDLLFPDGDYLQNFQRGANAEKAMAEAERQLAPKVSGNIAGLMDQAPNVNALGAAVNFVTGRPGSGIGRIDRMFSRDWERTMPQYAEPLLRFGMQGADEVEQLAAQLAAKNNGALGRAGKFAGNVVGAGASAIPYAGSAKIVGGGGDLTFGATLDDIFGPDNEE